MHLKVRVLPGTSFKLTQRGSLTEILKTIILSIKASYRWATAAACRTSYRHLFGVRSPLPGASIFHTDPLSQPCPVSFYFQNHLPRGLSRVFFITANHKRAVVLYCYTSHA